MLLTRPRLTAAGLLIASAAMFAAGAAIERHGSSEPHAVPPASSQTATSSDTAASTTGPETTTTAEGGGDESDADQGTGEHPTVAQAAPGDADRGTEHGTSEHSEKLLGINPEATPLTVAAVTVSVLLAVALLIIRSPMLAAGAALAMAAFTALDIREAIHQLNESRSGLAALASGVALLHVLAAAVALTIARSALLHPDTAASAPRSRLT